MFQETRSEMTEPEASDQYQPDRGEENIHHYTTEYTVFGKPYCGDLHIPDWTTQTSLREGPKAETSTFFGCLHCWKCLTHTVPSVWTNLLIQWFS